MTNPYESPAENRSPARYVRRFLVFAALSWLVVIALTLATVWGIVPLATALLIGWPFPIMAVAFQLANCEPPYVRLLQQGRWQHNVLTTDTLEELGTEYRRVLHRFSQGEVLIFQGTVFRLSPLGEVPPRLTASSSLPNRDIGYVRRVSAHLAQQTAYLQQHSQEFAQLTHDHEFRVAFFQTYESVEDEIGEYVDEHLIWF